MRQGMANAQDELYRRYLEDLRDAQILPREEELELARRYRDSRDPVAAARLVRGHLRLVVKIAHELDRGRRHVLDLVQEGNLGLLHAVERYDPERGAKLSVYAAWWIRAYMMRWLMANARLVRVGTTQAQRTLFFNLGRAETTHGGADDVAGAIAEDLGVTPEAVAEMQGRMGRSELSIESDPETGAEGLGERLSAAGDRPDEQLADEQIRAAVRAAIDRVRGRLNDRERHMLELRWMTDEQESLADVGRRLGVSRERARQIERRILNQVRAELRSVPEARAAA